MKTKKELRDEFKLMKFRMGIFQIINQKEKKIYLQIASDLDRAYNSDIFQLKAGMHSNKELQNDWNKLGSNSFEFKILDELLLDETASPEQLIIDLKELLEIHKDEMKSKGQLLY
ncbi:MAG: GIY-YIG nuclease family protein [Bacteroidales bacterium]|nr:GIY-YIG nuclease family protein [Bacteroidales bacterium]MDD4576583.1 GIY-YIG nuclease family protein [Bacteroidales bacterium]